MRALRIHAYGGPEQLKIDEVPEPHAGPGEIRIKVLGREHQPVRRQGAARDALPAGRR